jgi:hypothetical protein
MMSIGLPSGGGSIGSEPGSVIVVADYRMADEVRRRDANRPGTVDSLP